MVVALSCIQTPQSPAAKRLPVPAAPIKPPDFYISDLRVEPVVANIGESVKVSFKIANRGGPGDYRAALTLNGVENTSQTIAVREYSSNDANFSLMLTKMGKYQIGIGELKAALIVSDCGQKNPYSLKYDTGYASVGEWASGTYLTGNLGHITRFTPPTIPFIVQKILLYASAWVDNDQELDQHVATINLWDNKGKKIWSQDYSWRFFKGYSTWKEFTTPEINVFDDFNIEFVSHSEQSRPRQAGGDICVTLGLGSTGSADQIPQIRSGRSINGILEKNRYWGEGVNWLIRIEGQGCLLENKAE
jgi:hypothetical protein